MVQISRRYRFPVSGYSSHASVLHRFRDVITSLPVFCLVRLQSHSKLSNRFLRDTVCVIGSYLWKWRQINRKFWTESILMHNAYRRQQCLNKQL